MKFSNNYKKLSALLFLISFGMINAQKNITYEQALEIAFQQNGNLQNSRLFSEYQAKLKESYLDIPQTELTAQIGQVNGIETDNLFSISQRFSFPTVYTKKKQMLHEEWMAGIITQNLTKAQLKKEISDVFYRILILREKKKILEYTSILYNNFADKASIRLQKGEANIMEESTAEIQKEQAEIQLKMLENDLYISMLQLQLLIQSEKMYQPFSDQLTLPINLQITPESIDQHPDLQYLKQQIKVNESEFQLEKAKLLPEMLIAYTNQSMKNLNGNRFNAIQVGVGVPLFTKGQRALTKATKEKITISENQYKRKEIELKTRLNQQLNNYANQLKIIESYEKRQLPKSDTILKTVQKQMEAGEIDYLQWVILTNQAVKTKVDYIENLDKINQLGSEINFLLSK